MMMHTGIVFQYFKCRCYLIQAVLPICIFYFRSARVWLKRDSGQYWPSICQYLPSQGTSVHYNANTKQVYIGLENGTVCEFTLSDDCNTLTHTRDMLAHTARVCDVLFSLEHAWVLSISHDKTFHFYDSHTGRSIGNFLANAWCVALVYPL